ncbi:hypothetical protein F3Y22_tig00111794pilonHSYRG00116 [Hibiscus syriacus]|uniref:Uncharacterized protein n=1 Tax=Hibiscus syriacus TaxID=106335 RepID=A0A6A2YCX9_HIBSY|nr:hypothetical protein F3Y22_tig00111794pilonHSYRG00116 [Hibiscus syriacus]
MGKLVVAQVHEFQAMQVGQLGWQIAIKTVPTHVERQQKREVSQGWRDTAVQVHVGKIQGRDSATKAARNAGPAAYSGGRGPIIWQDIMRIRVSNRDRIFGYFEFTVIAAVADYYRHRGTDWSSLKLVAAMHKGTKIVMDMETKNERALAINDG